MQIQHLKFLILILLFVSCGNTKDLEISPEKEVIIPEEEETSKIVFLYFDIEKSGENMERITLTKTQVVDGELKENTIINEAPNEGNFILQILDTQKKVLEEQIIENPLNKNMEHYSQSGEPTSQNMKLNKGQFYMRFNKQKNMKSIKILRIQASEKSEIFSQPINL